jgi:hypothetical protein
MNRTTLILWGVVIVAIGGIAWWYLFSAGAVPTGQHPLADEVAFREAFRGNVSRNRIVAVLSPTTPADLATASQMQALLTEYENDTLDAHVIWQPLVSTDWAPTTDAMARVWDHRARHYWDKEKALRPLIGEGELFVFARGAGLNNPVLRVTDWKTDVPKIRKFLGRRRSCSRSRFRRPGRAA